MNYCGHCLVPTMTLPTYKCRKAPIFHFSCSLFFHLFLDFGALVGIYLYKLLSGISQSKQNWNYLSLPNTTNDTNYIEANYYPLIVMKWSFIYNIVKILLHLFEMPAHSVPYQDTANISHLLPQFLSLQEVATWSIHLG